MPLVFRLPPKEYQFLALQTAVYWALVIGHAAAGFGLLIGLPILPLVVVQIALLFHIWSTITGRVTAYPAAVCQVPASRTANRSSDLISASVHKASLDETGIAPAVKLDSAIVDCMPVSVL
ncbi:unnamed protein product [Protopolystoma xenopodis]|uniref:Uncharacterized protein n=1 Tax=Protopolystoma xenopodis TaxID=117903 RepID=A0A448XNX5_9PLAT|nr:unnamed protein product [Protopolystoma xenopodis]